VTFTVMRAAMGSLDLPEYLCSFDKDAAGAK
jgi:hypothetical protein